MLLTTVLLLLLDTFPVAAGIAERVGGAAALFKVIVSSFLVFCHFTHSLCIFLQVEPIFSRKPTTNSGRSSRRPTARRKPRNKFRLQPSTAQIAQISSLRAHASWVAGRNQRSSTSWNSRDWPCWPHTRGSTECFRISLLPGL